MAAEELTSDLIDNLDPEELLALVNRLAAVTGAVTARMTELRAKEKELSLHECD